MVVKSKKSNVKKPKITTTKSKKNLELSKLMKTASIASIIVAIIIIPSFILANIAKNMGFSIKLINTIVTILSVALTVYILRAYCGIAKYEKINFLKWTTRASIIVAIVIGILAILNLIFNASRVLAIIGLITLMLAGIVYLIFGISLFKISKKMKDIISILGTLYIILGVFNMTIFFMLITPAFAVAISILEAIMFNKLSKLY